MAMLFTYVAGWLFTIVLCFCMGEPADILASPMAQPVAQIFYNSLGKTGGMVYTCCAFIILQFVCFTATQALGRTVFAFSRDNLIPLSWVWTKVNRYTGTPLYAVWVSVAFCIAINLIGLGQYNAIAGVFNVCAIGLDWSYIVSLLNRVNQRIRVSANITRSLSSARSGSASLSLVHGTWARLATLSTGGLSFGLYSFRSSSSSPPTSQSRRIT
jgi:amino acid transporter